VLDVLVLCGGRGSRLAPVVSDVPKPMAEVGGRPFLTYVFEYILHLNVAKRIILATGYMAEKVEEHYGASYKGIPLYYSRETSPLGTGGAAVLASARYTLTTPFLMLNGDSFVNARIEGVIRRMATKKAEFGMVLFRAESATRYGVVEMVGNRVSGFREKAAVVGPGLVNSGIYLVKPSSLARWADHNGSLSLEYEVIPRLISEDAVVGEVSGERFIDIGTPESYQAANGFDFEP
jgi:D-glycero-alpha-D-manno-heptose 1-phosphate guanylyltransferase